MLLNRLVFPQRPAMNKNQIDPAESNFSARSMLTFLVVGGFSTGLHYLLTVLFAFGFGMPLVQASTIGFALSAIANYLLNARLTFRSKQAHTTTAPRFFATAGAGMLINALLLFLLVSKGLHALPAQILTTLGVILWNYSINGLWTFKKRANGE
jgi:putative flippase GtrA